MTNRFIVMRSHAILAALICLIFFGPTVVWAGQDAAGPTAILGAMPSEIELLRKNLSEEKIEQVLGLTFHVGKMNGRDVVLCRSGVGKVNAAMTTAILIDRFRPREILFSGIAGGLNPDLSPGDIIIVEKTAQHDYGRLEQKGFVTGRTRNPIDRKQNPLYFVADVKLMRLAKKAAKNVQLEAVSINGEKRTPKIIQGTVATGDVFVASDKASQEIRTRLNADAVEMEGAAVAQVCYQLKTPCLVIRSISDLADNQAEKDIAIFFKTAANNSANLVMGIVKKLATEKIDWEGAVSEKTLHEREVKD